jgi:hypothetical protein
MDQWTPRVTARRQLAEHLLAHPDRMRAANLLESDLTTIIEQGRRAEEADAEQNEQLAELTVSRSSSARQRKSLFKRESNLRDIVPAVVYDLQAAHPLHAEWLARLSFARFRLRELRRSAETPAADPAAVSGEEEELRSVLKVEREDQVTRARNLGRYCRALLREGREDIVAAFEGRNLARAAIEAMAADAEAIVEEGKNVLQASEATKREAEAAGAQKLAWNAVKRLFRRAVKGDEVLERKLAEC